MANGGSGGGGGTVFANIRPYDSHGYNGGSASQPSQTVPSGYTSAGGAGSKGNRGSGFSDGNPPPGGGGGSGSGTINALGYHVGYGSAGSAANRGHGASEGHNNSGGSGFVYILFPTIYTCTATNLTVTQGTYSGQNYIHIKGGTAGTILFS